MVILLNDWSTFSRNTLKPSYFSLEWCLECTLCGSLGYLPLATRLAGDGRCRAIDKTVGIFLKDDFEFETFRIDLEIRKYLVGRLVLWSAQSLSCVEGRAKNWLCANKK